MKYRRPRGLQDILPEKAGQWRFAEDSFRNICSRFRYEEIRTPIFEETDLFTRAVGKETDIVSKEMYTFEDRSGHSLTLRAEGTAPTIRAYLENNLRGQDRERLVKLFYIGPIFRYDRPQAGRYRQHHQCGLEALGSDNPAVDAEVIALALSFYKELGIDQVELRLNSVGCPKCAPGYVETLKTAIEPRREDLCGDCSRRIDANPLRLIDCKNPSCKAITTEAPMMLDVLCEECAEHFTAVREHLDTMEISYIIDPRIVRGLDYYTKTAFEFKATGLGAQDSIGGGGRYDGLVEQCGGPATPGVGVGMGLERVLLVREALGLDKPEDTRKGVFVITLGDEAWMTGLKLVQQLREDGVTTEVDYRRRSLKAQLRFADTEGYATAIILGEDELARGVGVVRDMASSEQREVALGDIYDTVAP